MKNILNILALEGCQGAGKTTLGAELMVAGSVKPSLPLITELKRPKQFEHSDNGAGLSLVTDLTWFLSAIQKNCYAPTKTPFLIDRFLISQWVYGQLREKGNRFLPIKPNYTELLTQTLDQTDIILHLLTLEYFRRLNIYSKPPVIEQLNIVYLFLIPSISLLTHRRKMSNRKYAYTPKQEIYMYTTAAEIVENTGRPLQILKGTENLDLVKGLINETFLSLSS